MTYQVDLNDLPVQEPARVMQGDTYRQPYQLLLNEIPLSLGGATLTAAVRRAPGRGRMVVEKSIAPDDAQAGTFTLILTAAETAQMLGEYYYEVEISWPAGHAVFPEGCVKTVVAGPLLVREDVLH